MEFTKTDQTIEIKPNTKILSAEELIKYRNVDTEPLRVGLKRTLVTGSAAEAQELNQCHAKLRQQISRSRIERLGAYSLGEWDPLEQAVRILRKEGKFQHFGYSRAGKEYLAYYEALFLLELGRLQLQLYEQSLSVEQAYLLLLGEASSPKFNEYLLYSGFMRVGYILAKYENAAPIAQELLPTASDCVWAALQQALNQKAPPAAITNCADYNQVQQSMTAITQRLRAPTDNASKEPSTSTTAASLVDFKRKIQLPQKRHLDAATSATPNKRNKHWQYLCNATEPAQSYLDFLKNEPEYFKFKAIFEKIDVIQLSPSNAYAHNARCRDFKISFDLHLHNTGFKKSAPRTPIYRVVLLPCEQPFPTHDEIAKCYAQQLRKLPLLVVSISASKQIQAFLYFFT